MILTWMHFIPWEPMNHDMVSIGNNGCKIVSEIEAQWEGDARIRTQAAGRTPCDARQPIIKVLNNNQYVNREKLNLDHSSWMWNEYHPVPVCHIWTAVSPWQMQEQHLNFTSLPRDKSSVQYSPARRNLGGSTLHCRSSIQDPTPSYKCESWWWTVGYCPESSSNVT